MVNLPVFRSILPLYVLSFSSARSMALTAVTPFGLTTVPVIEPVSAEGRANRSRQTTVRIMSPPHPPTPSPTQGRGGARAPHPPTPSPTQGRGEQGSALVRRQEV